MYHIQVREEINLGDNVVKNDFLIRYNMQLHCHMRGRRDAVLAILFLMCNSISCSCDNYILHKNQFQALCVEYLAIFTK